MQEEWSRQLNDLYRRLEYRWMELYTALNHRVFSLESEYRMRHSYFDSQRSRVSDYYPLPYVEARGFCEFQVEPDGLSCFAKMRKENCGVLNGREFRAYPFDVWGEDDFYSLLYRSGEDGEPVSDILSAVEETVFIVHFKLPEDIGQDAIYDFAKLMRKRDFFL